MNRMNRVNSVLRSLPVLALVATLIFGAGPAAAAGTWSVVPSPNGAVGFSNFLAAVASSSASDVWAVGYYTGNSGTQQTLAEHFNGSNWSMVPSPNVTGYYSVLSGVAAVSASDVWAVGNYSSLGNNAKTLTEHYDGTRWSVVRSPSVGTVASYLSAVAAVSTSDVWAVGYDVSSSGRYATLTEHYDGTSWSVVSSPNVGAGDNQFTAVTALSSSDVWAVGNHTARGAAQTLVEHYNGTGWSVIPSPNAGTISSYLSGVSATSASDAWAVGVYLSGTAQTLVEHYNGTTWSVVASPNMGSGANALSGVSATSASDVWAAGNYDVSSGTSQALVEHYDGSSWSVVTSPMRGSGANYLTAVKATSASDVWAVGVSYIGTGTAQTLAEHYNGTSWSVVPSPNVAANLDYLTGVSAVSVSDVWAVGYYTDSNGNIHSLIEHYDGSSWSVVPSPNPGGLENYLYGVSAASASDVWAVGFYSNLIASRTLIEHYDGSRWSVVSSPNRGSGGDSLAAVSATSASDVWAVGQYFDPITGTQTLIEHYDGRSWSVVSSPYGGTGNQFTGVSALSASDVWAVGYYNSTSINNRTLIEHFNGIAWSVVPSSNPGSSDYLNGVAATSASDVWAVGDKSNTGSGPVLTLVEHYNGTAWSAIPSPNVPGSHYNLLSAVSATSASDAWAVGYYVNISAGRSETLIEHYNGTSWSLVPSPNAGTGTNNLLGVAATSASDAWAVGNYTAGSGTKTLIEHYSSRQ